MMSMHRYIDTEEYRTADKNNKNYPVLQWGELAGRYCELAAKLITFGWTWNISGENDHQKKVYLLNFMVEWRKDECKKKKIAENVDKLQCTKEKGMNFCCI